MSHLIIIRLLCALLLGYTPVWCGSCGEPAAPSDVMTCETCGAHVCRICSDSYAYTVGGTGCFVCDSDAPAGELPQDYDLSTSVDVIADLCDAFDALVR